jgi:hypothetical protein
MTPEELKDKMLAFIETHDGEDMDDWYATRRDFASTVLSDFAEYLGLELVVPDYIPQLKQPEIDRNELFKALMPQICKLFDIEYNKAKEKNNGKAE